MDREGNFTMKRKMSSSASHHTENRLLTYKQFTLKLEDDIEPEEAHLRYEAYRTEYTRINKKSFFQSHKDEDWLKDLYHPSNIEAAIQSRKENSQHPDDILAQIVSVNEFFLGKDRMEGLVKQDLEAHIRRLNSYFFCGVEGCNKGFKGLEYAVKHLYNIHGEIVEPYILKSREMVYFENYMSDPNAPYHVARSSSMACNDQRNSKQEIMNSRAVPVPVPVPPEGRRVCEYNDLDAPQDEQVQVVDYRVLS
ncbi:hypothetical protein SUGI_0526370 [Cryptomeria japonica]|nr:hypothetical protein SUGI_0526370 [Cryptomeria japonica]